MGVEECVTRLVRLPKKAKVIRFKDLQEDGRHFEG